MNTLKNIEKVSDDTYQVKAGEIWADVDDLIDNIRNNGNEVYELGVDVLPDDIDDIRGLIHDQPARVFVEVGDGYFGYFGFDEQ